MSADGERSHLGIPAAKFVDDVDKFMAEEAQSAEGVIRKMDETYQKYKMMDFQLHMKKNRLKSQIPDLKMTLDMISHLKDIKDEEKTLETHFLLSGSLRAKATVPPTKEVGLWLGANVMLMYSIEDAHALLSKNLETAKKHLDGVYDDLDYLRDQCTTTEVSMARIHNWQIARKKGAGKSE